jgi:hypothetical protein
MTLPFRLLLCSLTLVAVFAGKASAQEALHSEIDRLIDAESTGAAAPITSDAEFLRRVSIDLIGMPPTLEELQAFLADTASTKREQAIDRLLNSPLYARNLAAVFDVMLMERRGNANVSADEWQAWLLKSMQDNKPYNVLAKEILSADGVDPAQRAAARFYLDRGGEPNLITRDVGRIFFGRDYQCNQCHDHPIIADYYQTDYHGLLAFFGASSNMAIKTGDAEKTYYVERAATDGLFESVFIKGIQHITRPKLPGEPELAEPTFYPGDEYTVRPAANVQPIPKYSRRAKLAELATSGTNRAFNENIANRLWGHMLGRGLVSPPDLHHSANPPTHPELLRRLGERFAEMNFDVRAFLREVALSQTYQRSIDRPKDLERAAEQAATLLPQLASQRETLSGQVDDLSAKADAALTAWAAAEAALLPALAERDAARAKSQEVVKKLDDARKAVSDAQNLVNAKAAIATPVGEAATKAQEAAKLLPQDQELAAAAAKFTERAAALAAEVETLKKAVEEKTAAVAVVDQELLATRPAIDESQKKVSPLEDDCRTKYDALALLRIDWKAAESRLASLDQRIETIEELEHTKALRADLAAAEQAVAPLREIATTATGRQTEIGPAIANADEEHQRAVKAAAAAAQALSVVSQEHANQREAIDAVNAAVATSESALEKLPGDSTLTEAVQNLKARAGELVAAFGEHQKAVDASAAANQAAAETLNASRAAFEEVIADRGRREAAAEAARQAVDEAMNRVTAARSELDGAMADLQKRWASDSSIAALESLSPEQLCASIFRVTGIYKNYRAGEVAELEKASPLSDADKQDPAKRLAREREIEQRVYDKLLKTNTPTFVNLFGAGAGQPQGDFFASAEQALYTANGGSILSWAGQNGDNVTTKIVNEQDTRKAAELLYLTVLSRAPSEEEVQDVAAYLGSRGDQKAAAAQELVWGLIASVEFRFNH